MNYNRELDRCQCQALKTDGKRCTLIARHSNGGKALCPRHHAMLIPKKGKK
jgi:hypothetical protein